MISERALELKKELNRVKSSHCIALSLNISISFFLSSRSLIIAFKAYNLHQKISLILPISQGGSMYDQVSIIRFTLLDGWLWTVLFADLCNEGFYEKILNHFLGSK